MKPDNQAKDLQKVKKIRQDLILKLIEEEQLSTQNDLMKRLKQEGFVVTQATISRDIHDLQLVKIVDSEGVYHYTIGKPTQAYQVAHKFYSIFEASVFRVDSAGNIVVIRCYPGMAKAVCATMDSIEWPGALGTVSGDDTIMVILKDASLAKKMVDDLMEIQ